MPAAAQDVDAIVSKWTLRQRKQALAAILRDLKSKKPLVIKDELNGTVGFLMPIRPKAHPFDMSVSTPYVEEIKRRIATAEQSISVEEVNAMLDRRAVRSGPK